MFVKTFPVYCRWNNESRVADVLRELSQQMNDSRKNDIYSFADVNRICPMKNQPMFAYHGLIKTTSTFCGLPCKEEFLDKNATGTPFLVELLAKLTA